MSLDLSFNKDITFDDVMKNTSINVEFHDNNWWLTKNNGGILIKTYTDNISTIKYEINKNNAIFIDENDNPYSLKQLKELIKQQYDNPVDITNIYMISDWCKTKKRVYLDKGKYNIIHGITKYGMVPLFKILDEFLITFQVKFITDDEEELIWRGFYGNTRDEIENLYNIVTSSFGYYIDENGIISKPTNIDIDEHISHYKKMLKNIYETYVPKYPLPDNIKKKKKNINDVNSDDFLS